MADYVNLNTGEPINVEFPYEDCREGKQRGGKVFFNVKIGGETKTLAVERRAFDACFKPALGIGEFVSVQENGYTFSKAALLKGQTLTVVKVGDNPNMPKKEAYKDPEICVRTLDGRVFSTSVPFDFGTGSAPQTVQQATQGVQQPVAVPVAEPVKPPERKQGPEFVVPFENRLNTFETGFSLILQVAEEILANAGLEYSPDNALQLAQHFSSQIMYGRVYPPFRDTLGDDVGNTETPPEDDEIPF